ncbi:MAG: Rieske 2Fe-2S domain-containing protein [Pigmentiphaga sp.]
MFSAADNERLTQTGPGTPMGNVFRRFWIPFLLPEELAEPDQPPLPVRLLGEELLAFRDSEGRPGLVERYCPHRRADLFLGRNEQSGLRCVYHGWKFDVHGNILEMPAEPADTPLRNEINIQAYPVREWGGLIWAYMGEPEHMPDTPPELEWGRVPPAHRHITKRLQETNYAQGVEGGIDSSHVGILHSLLDEDTSLPFKQRQIPISSKLPYLAADTAPRFFVRRTDYGMVVGARRQADEDHYYWRITQYLTPFYTMIAPRPGGPISGHAWVPIDDENCWVFTMTWDTDQPLADLSQFDPADVHANTDAAFRSPVNRSNLYGLDREAQRLRSMTGIRGIGMQDAAVQESMGPIVNRSTENLGASDAAIVNFRKLLLRLASSLEQGLDPAPPKHPEWYRVRSAGVVLEKQVDFQAGAADLMRATA